MNEECTLQHPFYNGYLYCVDVAISSQPPARFLETTSAEKNIVALIFRCTIDDPLRREMWIVILKLENGHITIIARPGLKGFCGVVLLESM
jgi:hypothetical protein|tara:strand:- start:355 stop:627 length:273 start_codon:yes stop_codon:yes gene_type:complete